jgi:cytochrome c-type biogenesis protein CcmF
MPYTGEQLLPGQVGHLLVLISFMASLVATYSFYRASSLQNTIEANGWQRMARIAFFIEVIAVTGIFLVLYYIISRHLFEYKYAWQHSNLALPMQYILSCFWEGQEGSFLLWSFWHCVLGIFIIKRKDPWEAPVMTIISFMQLLLASMVIGLYFFDFKLGSSPFVLMRNEDMLSPDKFPIGFNADGSLRTDYLSFIRDGNGLNPLLQNYWMTIHPPVLFLGFASTIIPFSYAVAGLWKRDFSGWISFVRPWALFSAGMLGLGIMMGAAWAYESLTFGGYWAWDPVENASLVPWMVLVTGVHTLLIYQHSGQSLRSTFLFLTLQFLFIVYSTFLTRSGILGDTSVHAFTDLGMNTQLLIFLLAFAIPALVLLAVRYKQIPQPRTEEHFSSREFWMFVGSLLLFISSIYIIAKTSLPVYNKMMGTKYAPPADIEYSYNKVLILFSFVIGILTAIGQFLKYKESPRGWLVKGMVVPALISILMSLAVSIWGGIEYNKYGPGYLTAIHLSLWASIFAIISNAYFIVSVIQYKMKHAGASVTHIGFGLMLLGILISSSKKEILSWNTSGIQVNFGPDSQEKTAENLTLVKGVATDMGKYMVTYLGDSAAALDPKQYFKIQFQSKDSSESFVLYPDAFVNYKGNQQLMANPSSKHYLHKDVFTYITSLPNPEKNKDTATFQSHKIKPGDTIFYSRGFMILDGLSRNPGKSASLMQPGDSVFSAQFTIRSVDSSIYQASPVLMLRNNTAIPVTDTVLSQSLILAFTGAGQDGIEVGVKESNAVLEYVTLKAYQFPGINILWLGVIVMTAGFFISAYYKFKRNPVAVKKMTNSDIRP